MMGEASKIRDRVKQWINGNVLDVCCRDDKITPDSIGIDREYFAGVNIVGDCRNLRWFQKWAFETIFSSHGLEHLDNPQEALEEWCRVLKPGGNLILYLPETTLYRTYGMASNPEHLHEFTIDEAIMMINRAMPAKILF